MIYLRSNFRLYRTQSERLTNPPKEIDVPPVLGGPSTARLIVPSACVEKTRDPRRIVENHEDGSKLDSPGGTDRRSLRSSRLRFPLSARKTVEATTVSRAEQRNYSSNKEVPSYSDDSAATIVPRRTFDVSSPNETCRRYWTRLIRRFSARHGWYGFNFTRFMLHLKPHFYREGRSAERGTATDWIF